MTWALRITRDPATGRLAVHPLFRTGPRAQAFRLFNAAHYAVESLQVFSDLRLAQTAAAAERRAARYQLLPPGELARLLEASARWLDAAGLPLRSVCRFAGQDHAALVAMLHRLNPPNPRAVARLRELVLRLRALGMLSRRLLPAKAGLPTHRRENFCKRRKTAADVR